jgi:putative sigma-54 modulation protein
MRSSPRTRPGRGPQHIRGESTRRQSPHDLWLDATRTLPILDAQAQRTISGVTVDIVVVGKDGEVDTTLRTVTIDKVERVNKFASDVRRIEVDYEHHPTRRAEDSHTCEILVHVNQQLVKGSAAATEYAIALDRTLDKVEQQMRRLHERRVGRRNGARSRGVRAAVGADPDTTDVDADEPGLVVKTKEFSVKPMDVEEAALQMDLLGHDFFLFSNADSGRAAVIYRRRDGQLGLIEATG